MIPFVRRAAITICALLAFAGATTAHALDRITLRNGFTYDCARMAPADLTHTRLFLAATQDAGYVDVPTAEITAVDTLPDPPPPAAHRASPTALANASIPALLASAGAQHNIDVALLTSLVHAESSGHPHAISHAGAQGLMQLMPSTARALGVSDSLAPDQNINGGTSYLDALLTRYGNNLALALAAYNAGPGAVDRFHGIPPYRETRAYVIHVMTEFKRRKAALAHPSATNTLQASR